MIANKISNLLIIFIMIVLSSCSTTDDKTPQVRIYTPMGDIDIELYPEKAPKSVAAFLSYIDSGYYNNGSFYRVLKADEFPAAYNPGVVQGGMFREGAKEVPGIPHESTKQTGLSHTNGIVSLARREPGTAGTEFFICVDDQRQLDYGNGETDKEGYAAFGKVIKGMSVVRKIQDLRRTGEQLDHPVTITKIKKL